MRFLTLFFMNLVRRNKNESIVNHALINAYLPKR